MTEDDFVRLSAEDELLFENYFGKLSVEPTANTPLNSEETACCNSVFGKSHPQEPCTRLSASDEVLFNNFFGHCFGDKPLYRYSVKNYDLIGTELKKQLQKSIDELSECVQKFKQIRATAKSGNDQWLAPIRNGQPRAQVYPLSCQSTIESLAELIGLDADDALGEDGWLRSNASQPLSEFKPCMMKPFTVPNTVFCDFGPGNWRNMLSFGNNIDLFWKDVDIAKNEARNYEAQGYSIFETEKPAAEHMIAHLQSNHIFAYIFCGHGDGTGALHAEGGYVMPARYTSYKLHHMTLLACESLKTNLAHEISMDHGMSIWNANVATHGWVEGFWEEANRGTENWYKGKFHGNAKLKPKHASDYDRRKNRK